MRALPVLLSLVVLLAGPSKADEWTMESIYTAKDKIVIPVGQAATTHSLDLPTIERREGKRVCVRFKAYLEMPAPGGWNPYLTIAVNGRPLGPALASGENRLINRGQSCETKKERLDWWGRNLAGNDALLTFFGPGDVLDERIIQPRDEPCWYVLDISDAVNYVQIGPDGRTESARPNKMVLSNTCLKGYLEKGTAVHHMAVEGLTVGYLPENVAAQHQLAALAEYKGAKEKERLDGDGCTVVVTESGGIRIDVQQDRYFLASSFSYPGPTVGYNRLDPDTLAGQDGWKPQIRKVDRQTIRIEAASPQYEVARTLWLREGRLRISDQFTNTTGAPIGVLICNSLAIPGFPRPGRHFLGGLENQSSPVNGSAENPTVFVAQTRSSIGIVAEDNVYRLQLALSRRANVFDMTTGHFGLDAKKAYTLEWTVYPRPHQDYWAFVNEVRRDWNVNFTIPGPFAYGDPEKGRKTAIACIGPWIDYDDGAAITREQYKATWAKVVAKLRKDDPNLIVMPKLENNLVAIDKRKVGGGQLLPVSKGAKGGQYGLELTKEQTAGLEKNTYADSVLRTADGRMIVDTYYAKEPYINLLLYPVKGNARYKAYFEQIDFLMDQVGFNGIYIDQFSLSWGAMDSPDRRSLDKWDGHSVDIDEKTGKVVRKYIDCALVGADARADVLIYILRKGGKVVVNTFPCVRETQSLPVFRFAEMENDPVNPLTCLKDKPPAAPSQAKGHLASPIILGVRPARWGQEGKDHWAELITKAVITGLRNGLLYYYYTGQIPSDGPGAGEYGPVNHMFPFTPVELHSGWLVGKERIIACVSGTYPWPHKQAPVCLRFDLRGREMPHGFQVARQGDGWQARIVLDDWNEIAVMEEPPETLTGPAE